MRKNNQYKLDSIRRRTQKGKERNYIIAWGRLAAKNTYTHKKQFHFISLIARFIFLNGISIKFILPEFTQTHIQVSSVWKRKSHKIHGFLFVWNEEFFSLNNLDTFYPTLTPDKFLLHNFRSFSFSQFFSLIFSSFFPPRGANY